MKSLLALNETLSSEEAQLIELGISASWDSGASSFAARLKKTNLFPLKPTKLEVFQINLGKMCNQVCKHCHVDAGPDRKEIMTREVIDLCLKALDQSGAHTADLTGGAPEMNPEFRYLVEQLNQRKIKVIVRCNLTIIMANKKYHDLPVFFRKNNVEVVSSLPFYTSAKTDSQRGDGVFKSSIEALILLNKEGYGIQGSGLILNLVYNPAGAFLPPEQNALEKEFKQRLSTGYQISFNNLFTITNLPVSRFLDYLIKTKNFDSYMHKLIDAYNPLAATGVMCRNMVSIGWDGKLYDCDFNQMLALEVDVPGQNRHISQFNELLLSERDIVINQHCFGCTAGAGSSCGGTTV